MKRLIARKCKDGYLIEITKTFTVKTSSEVKRIAIQNGLRIHELSNNDKITAS